MENDPTLVNNEVVEEIPVVPELPDQRYEYQPLDEHGHPIGGKQALIYKTSEELADKLRDQNISLLRKLREVSRKQRLGINDNSVPDDAQRFEDVVELRQIELSAEERFQLSEALKDPEHFAEARDRLLESAVGVPPKKLVEILNKQQMTTLQLLAKSNYDTFERNQNEFYPCQENKELLTDWMFKNGLAPTVDNFRLASSELKKAGLLSEAPVRGDAPTTPEVVEPAPVEPKAQASVPQVSRITDPEAPQPKRQVAVPSSLTNRNSSSTGSSSGGVSITLADIDRMPAEEYKRKLRDPAFIKLVDQLEKEKAARLQGNA